MLLLVSPPALMARGCRTGAFAGSPAPMEQRSLKSGRELRLVLWLRRLVAAERVDLVHVRFHQVGNYTRWRHASHRLVRA